jgi:uncharacterized protein (DUF1800 family)
MKPAGLVTGIAALIASVTAISGNAPATFEKGMAADKQPLHVLNRLAYGPRPGDVEAVRRMGVKKWITQQLEPAKIKENPVLLAKLDGLATINLPTWQLIETIQPPQMQMNMSVLSMAASLPSEKMMLLTSNNSTMEERRVVLAGMTPEVRSQALASVPQQLIDGIPEYREEAARARQSRQDMLSRQSSEQQRRLRPPLSELFTPDELNILRHGSDAEKMALLAPFGQEKKAQVFRSMGPQGAQLLPASYRREAMLVANPQQGVVDEVIESKLQRAVFSNRQLEEVLVDFWFNHFNVSVTKQQLRNFLPGYERDAIRPHVLGKFRDMLLATARHPAMLFYLDNYQSQAPRPEMLQAVLSGNLNIRLPGINENYGRELMELHTMGVDGGYTQEDVVNVARAFTGWTIFDVMRVGEFQFNPQTHDRNEKKVLGKVFPRGGGESEGVAVIDMLSRHPSTARFISRKLAQRFVADDPPAVLVDRMAATFTKTDGDLRAVMETLLFSREFLSEGAWRSKVKSPLEMVAGSLRALDADVTDTAALAQRIADLGQPLYAKAEPTGYPNTSESWSNSVGLLGRMNFSAALVSGQINGVTVKPEMVAVGDVQRSMQALTGVPAPPEAIAAVEKSAAGKPPAPALIATALIGSPDFQKR